mmetsp:Transcript_7425/g.10532  ORF Transcript_7425/g.10532 Transcript_7425/m.10532 type:complete len:192 (-) Transcript_7425:366-941(-)
MALVLSPLNTKTTREEPTSLCRSTYSKKYNHQNPPTTIINKNKREERINVFFRFVDGITFCLLIHPFLEDIESIRKRLVESHNKQQGQNDMTKLHMKANDLVLMWNGKPIDDCNNDNNNNKTRLADYNLVKDGAHTIHVSVRQKGGCFMISFTILMIICTALVGSTCTCGLSLLIVPILMPLLFVLPLFCL